MIRYRLLAVWLLDNRIDVEWTQNVHCSFVINNDHSIAVINACSTVGTEYS
jgi:hypothetical protein